MAGKAVEHGQGLGYAFGRPAAYGRPAGSSCLTLQWVHSGYCGHLGSNKHKEALSPCVSISLSVTFSDKQNKSLKEKKKTVRNNTKVKIQISHSFFSHKHIKHASTPTA